MNEDLCELPPHLLEDLRWVFFMPTREKHVFLQRLQQTIWQLEKTNLAELPHTHFFAAYIGQGCCPIDPVPPSLLNACFCFPLTVVKFMSREYPFQWVFVSSMGSYFPIVHKLVLHIGGFIRKRRKPAHCSAIFDRAILLKML